MAVCVDQRNIKRRANWTENQQALNGISQLSNIPSPRCSHERIHRTFVHLGDLSSSLSAEHFQKVLDQNGISLALSAKEGT